MTPLSLPDLRDAFVNVTLRERKAIVLPDEPDWDAVDYLGWRDPRLPQLGYVAAEVDGRAIGMLLRQAERTPRARAQCSWCEDVQLPNDVVFFAARRAGDAGRRGDTLGSLVCAHFECSTNVRRRPATAYVGFDVEAERRRRIESLRERVTAFLRNGAAGA